MPREPVDTSTKGTVARYLVELAKSGQIKECKRMRLDHSMGTYYPHCEADFAEKLRTGTYGDYYFWPKCPAECPHFDAVATGGFHPANAFLKSVGRDQYDADREQRELKRKATAIASALDAQEAAKAPASKAPAKVPTEWPGDKVTFSWLFQHMPASVWIRSVTIVGTIAVLSFLAGLYSTRSSVVREWAGLSHDQPAASNRAPTKTEGPK